MCDTVRTGVRTGEEAGRKDELAVRNFQSVFLPPAKQELGGEAGKRGWNNTLGKQGLPLWGVGGQPPLEPH